MIERGRVGRVCRVGGYINMSGETGGMLCRNGLLLSACNKGCVLLGGGSGEGEGQVSSLEGRSSGRQTSVPILHFFTSRRITHYF